MLLLCHVFSFLAEFDRQKQRRLGMGRKCKKTCIYYLITLMSVRACVRACVRLSVVCSCICNCVYVWLCASVHTWARLILKTLIIIDEDCLYAYGNTLKDTSRAN